MLSFLRNLGSNYAYHMLKILALTKFWKKICKDKKKKWQFFAYPLENSVKGVYLLTLLKNLVCSFFCCALIK